MCHWTNNQARKASGGRRHRGEARTLLSAEEKARRKELRTKLEKAARKREDARVERERENFLTY